MSEPSEPSEPSELSELREAVAGLRAREEIRELLHRYGFAADAGDALAWSRAWADDAVYDGSAGQLAGRDQFYAAIDDPDGTHKREIESHGSLHTVGGVIIRVDGDRAWAEGHALVWVRAGRGYRVYSLTYNHWDLHRTRGSAGSPGSAGSASSAGSAGSWEITRRLSRAVEPGAARHVLQAWASTGPVSP